MSAMIAKGSRLLLLTTVLMTAAPLRRRLQKSFDAFIDIRGIPDDVAARKIRNAEIDILVNLNGYFGGQRMGVFAKRPCPVQVNYLGFPGTLGAPYIDYIIADRTVIPESDAAFYDEKIVYLPCSYQANDSNRPIANKIPTTESLGLPTGSFVFCNFNAPYKLVPTTFKIWMEILAAVDKSVLWLQKATRRSWRTSEKRPCWLVFSPAELSLLRSFRRT